MSKVWSLLVCSVILTGCMSGSKEFSRSLDELNRKQSQEMFDEQLTLRGMGVKHLLFAKVFTAGLYLSAEVESENALDVKVAKRISVMFYVKIPAQAFANYTIDNIKPNLTKQELDSIQVEMGRLKELFPDIKPGDALALSYKPGEGTSFIHNGQVRGVVLGELFSKAIFSTWIGVKPFDQKLKHQVLGMV